MLRPGSPSGKQDWDMKTPGRVKSQLPQPRFVLAALVAFSACERGPDAHEIVHPTAENAPPADAARIVRDGSPQDLTSEALASWRSVRDSLLTARTTLRIGRASGDNDPAVFGRISDALVAPWGDIFVLDDQAQEVRIFDSTGRAVQAIGRIGDGPAEFRSANGIEILGDGRLLVSTRSRGLRAFVETSDGWELDEVIDIPVVPEDMCAVGDRAFLSGWGQARNTVVHEVVATTDGPHRPFGSGYKAAHWLLRSQMADGVVGCFQEASRVVFAFELLPVVRSFDPGSRTNTWTARIEGFAPAEVVEGFDARGAYVTRRRTDTEDLVGGLHGLGSDHFLLQTARLNSRARTITVNSFLVDARTGNGASLGDDLPVIFDPTLERYIAMFEDPFPRIELRTLNGDR